MMLCCELLLFAVVLKVSARVANVVPPRLLETTLL